MLLGLLADGHVLIDDNPGLAKTLMARSFAQVIGLRFSRVQFTPDLMPSDVTGSTIFNQRTSDFEFRPGPLFANLLLGDEINRAPPKTQAALLEAMQERQVTADGTTHRLPAPFFVIATQNPIEYEGTYPLPEAQLDRFLLRTAVGYPDAQTEWEMLEQRIDRGADDVVLETVVSADELIAMQRALEQVHVSESVGRYVVDLVGATRESAKVEVGASPRGSLAVMKLARARGARRPRVRDARRREGRGGAGARAPARAPHRALGAARAARVGDRRDRRVGRTPPAEDLVPIVAFPTTPVTPITPVNRQ